MIMRRRLSIRLTLWSPALSLAAALCSALVSTPAALATWSASVSGSGAAAAATMPVGTSPRVTLSGTNVTVTWTAASLSSGVPVAGYTVSRFNTSTGASVPVGAGCSGIVTTTSCTENGVAAGTWVYTDTPVEGHWTGGQSSDSASITVP
jgi:hypothetical protein